MTEKLIRLSGHARQQLQFRGGVESEIIEGIRTTNWQPADRGRLECRKNYPYNAEWNRKYYATRQIRPIFVDEPHEIVGVTIYTYYF